MSKKNYQCAYNENDSDASHDIWRQTGEPALKSLLFRRYIRRMFTWGNNASLPNLNSRTEINGEFNAFDFEINDFSNLLKNSSNYKCICNPQASCELHNYLTIYKTHSDITNYKENAKRYKNVEIQPIKFDAGRFYEISDCTLQLRNNDRDILTRNNDRFPTCNKQYPNAEHGSTLQKRN